MDDSHKNTLEELRVAIAELESEDGLSRFVEGHGLQSRRFEFAWSDGTLSLEFRLPYARVLADEEDQAEDAANVGGALRLAILLIAADAEGRLLADGEASLSVSADASGLRYAFADKDGETLDSGNDWSPLMARLAAAFPGENGGVEIIWP